MSDLDQNLELDILDQDIDDIEEVAGFEVPPNGVYGLELTVDLKEVNEKTCVEYSFVVEELLEQNDKKADAGKIGSKFSQLFFLSGFKDEAHKLRTLSDLKLLNEPLSAHFEEGNLLRLIREKLNTPLKIVGTVKRRADKEDKERFYGKVSNIQVK